MSSLKVTHIVGAVFTMIFGTLLHFLWAWTGYSRITAIFSAVNESTWEHLKLLFFPFAVFTIIEYFLYGREKSCFFTVKLRAVLLGMAVIVTVFYTYTGVLGDNYLPLDIGTFILGVAAAYGYSYRQMQDISNVCSVYREAAACVSLVVIGAAFGVFTFAPPALGIFQPPTP